jgi:Protein of unknown function (DUF3592)
MGESHSELTNADRYWIIGLVIAALVFFYVSIDTGIHEYKRFNKATGVALGQVVVFPGFDDEGKPLRSPKYQFRVDGIDYDGSVGNQDQSLAEGDPVQVYYNPSNPKFNHAQGESPSYAFVSLLTFLGAICLIGVFMIVREGRKQLK